MPTETDLLYLVLLVLFPLIVHLSALGWKRTATLAVESDSAPKFKKGGSGTTAFSDYPIHTQSGRR